MKLKYTFGVLILGVASGLVLDAQFGGIKIPGGRPKETVDRATDRAKPVTDRAEKVSDAPVPAKALITPSAETLRIRWFRVSAMNMFPEASIATP